MVTGLVEASGSAVVRSPGTGASRGVADPDLLEVRVDPKHRGECQCDLLWARVSQRYDLDALSMPDEILRTRPEWAGGAQGWWLWWD